MNRFEKILGIIFLIALIFKIANLPGGSILATISLMSLGFIYFFGGFAFFNKIEIENIFCAKSYKGISALRMMGSIGFGLGLSQVCMGILFQLQHWQGKDIVLPVGLITVFVLSIIALVKFSRSKTTFYKAVLLRAAVIGGLGLFLLTTNLV